MKIVLVVVAAFLVSPVLAQGVPGRSSQGDIAHVFDGMPGSVARTHNLTCHATTPPQCVDSDSSGMSIDIGLARVTLDKGGRITGPFVVKDKDGNEILSIPAGSFVEIEK